jgi:hypothetical protein
MDATCLCRWLPQTWCSKALALDPFPLAPLCDFTQIWRYDDACIFESNDRESLRVSRLRENKISNFLCFQLPLPRAKDLKTCGPPKINNEIPSWLWTSGKSNLKPGLPRDFTRSHRSDNTWHSGFRWQRSPPGL